MMKEKNQSEPIMVSVQVLVFNHEPYLRDCLNGIVKQRTNFRFEAIVHDDCSTDHSADIIREYAAKYPDIIKPIYEKENQYHKKGGLWNAVSPHLKGKYIAFCEGDDYWTNPNKLQIQAEFMEAHPEFSMCFHAVNIEENKVITHNDSKTNFECNFSTESIIAGGGPFCATCSLFIRSDIYNIYPKFRMMANVGDYPLQVLCASKGKIHYFPYLMGVYRYNSIGSWNERNKKIPYKQIYNDFQWLKEFDKYSKYKYHKAVYKLFTSYDKRLYKLHLGNILKLYSDSRESGLDFVQSLKGILLTIAEVRTPLLLSTYANLKKNIKGLL